MPKWVSLVFDTATTLAVRDLVFHPIYEWNFDCFSLPKAGEWCQRHNREGKPMAKIIALPVKDPFHLPRALILSLELLRKN